MRNEKFNEAYFIELVLTAADGKIPFDLKMY